MRDRKNATPAVIGGSSLIMVFAVLCLTVFTLLTLSTIQADRRLSEVTAKAVSSYYSADAEAERIFSELRSGTLPDGIEVHGDLYSYSCPISETQTLYVELSYSDGIWTVLCWQSVASIK